MFEYRQIAIALESIAILKSEVDEQKSKMNTLSENQKNQTITIKNIGTALNAIIEETKIFDDINKVFDVFGNYKVDKLPKYILDILDEKLKEKYDLRMRRLDISQPTINEQHNGYVPEYAWVLFQNGERLSTDTRNKTLKELKYVIAFDVLKLKEPKL